jgi:enoyl-CoA hydratase/carnithine racemase
VPLGALASTELLYAAAARLCEVGIPWIAAVHGPAIGGGLGLALTANLRVTCPEARFAANFVRLGIHQGFGLSVTLPELVGPSRAALVLLTGRRFHGDEATELGLADICVPADEVRSRALSLAAEVAEGAPLAIRSINRTLRAGLGDRVRQATRVEAGEQARLGATADAAEGIASVFERRPGRFAGR